MPPGNPGPPPTLAVCASLMVYSLQVLVKVGARGAPVPVSSADTSMWKYTSTPV